MPPESKKYFFDLNNFDAPAVPEPEENLPPPPPTFSEQELMDAKQAGYEDGFKAGREEEYQHRAQYISTQLAELNTQMLGIVLAEQRREKLFEQEVIQLCRALMRKLFPRMTEISGTIEIEHIISKVIQNQPPTRMVVEVPMHDRDDIEVHLKTLKDIDHALYTVVGVDEMTRGNCRIKWENGGALRDHEALAAAIFKELDESLAPPAQKVHNNESDNPHPHKPELTGENNGKSK